MRREAVVHADPPEAELPAVATRPDATLDIAVPSTGWQCVLETSAPTR